MKKMKFIPFILMAISLMVTSCVINDDYPVEARQTTDATVSPVQIDMYAGEGTDFRFAFELSQALAQDMLVEYTTSSGAMGSVIMAAGTTMSAPVTASYPVDTEYTFEGVEKDMVVNMDLSVMNKPDDLNVSGSGSITVTVFDKLPATEADKLNILVDWIGGEDGSKDMEVFIISGNQNAFGATIDYVDTWGVNNRWEEVSMNETEADGTYSYFLREYYGAYPIEAFKIFIRESDGTLTMMDGEMTSGPVYGGAWIFTYAKTTTGSTVSYTYNQL